MVGMMRMMICLICEGCTCGWLGGLGHSGGCKRVSFENRMAIDESGASATPVRCTGQVGDDTPDV